MNLLQMSLEQINNLIAEQFPNLLHLPLKKIDSAGTDNFIFQLGTDLILRIPKSENLALHINKEQLWLPRLAPYLPITIPRPLYFGTSSKFSPFAWSIYEYISGKNATYDNISDLNEAAIQLGKFLKALQKIDTTDGPLAGEQNFFRGVPLKLLNEKVVFSLNTLDGLMDIKTMYAIWRKALLAPEWGGKPTWIHGDLHAGNLLANKGKLKAIIDFGGLGIGDPACDIMVAWTYLSSEMPNFRH